MMTGLYGALATLVVLALVVWFVASPRHAPQWRILVAAVYAGLVVTQFMFPPLHLAALLLEVGLGIALVLVRRWERDRRPRSRRRSRRRSLPSMPPGPPVRLSGQEGQLVTTPAARRVSRALTLTPLALLLALVAASCATAPGDYKVFYCVHQKKECVSPDHPTSMSRDAAMGLMKTAATEKDAFLGFVDSKDVTLQFYTRQPHRIWVEIPVPERKGSYGRVLTEDKALAVIRGLSGDLERQKEALGLKFEAW
jgi:hypothetical protein